LKLHLDGKRAFLHLILVADAIARGSVGDYTYAHKERDICGYWSQRPYGATFVAVTSQHISAAESPEQGSGKRWAYRVAKRLRAVVLNSEGHTRCLCWSLCPFTYAQMYNNQVKSLRKYIGAQADW